MRLIDQIQWGSSKVYADGDLNGSWDPQYIIVHWGGLTRERDTFELATATLRGWQAYHIGKGWQDIAYNYAIDELGNMYRLRGENHAGHTSGTAPNGQKWNSVGVGIVWIGGKGDEDGPSLAALATLDRYTKERDLPVLGHVETGKATACPGPDLLDYIHNGLEEEIDMSIGAWAKDGFIENDTPQVLTKGWNEVLRLDVPKGTTVNDNLYWAYYVRIAEGDYTQYAVRFVRDPDTNRDEVGWSDHPPTPGKQFCDGDKIFKGAVDTVAIEVYLGAVGATVEKCYLKQKFTI